MHEPKPRFLAPIGKPRDYVDRPEIAVPGEPECIGPAILDSYAESNAFKHAQQHALDVALAQKLRPLLAAEDRIRDVRRRAKFAHVDLSHEARIMERDLERARRGNRKPPARVLDRLERLEGALDGLAA